MNAKAPRRATHVATASRLGLVGVLVVASLVWMALTHAHPAFDSYGWMVWGRQTLAGNLNTNAAPSWKPLPYLFDLPFALFGNTQMWLWTFTATALGLSGCIFAYRVAARLATVDGTDPGARASWPRVLAGVLGAAAYVCLYGLWRQLLITDTDPIVISLCLAAVDAHLSGHRRLCLIALLFAALGRPEVWPFLGLYGLWLGLTPGNRVLVAGSILLIPVAWFLVPGLTSRTWFQSGTAALGFHTAIRHGDRIIPVLERIRSLYDTPVWLGVAAAFVGALWRRDRVWLTLFGAAGLWVIIEIAFAYHDWPAAPRYLMEPAALLGVLAAAAAGRAAAFARGLGSRHGLGRIAVSAGGLALAVVLVPFVIGRVGALAHDAHHELEVTRQMQALGTTIDAYGGARQVKACAPTVTVVGDQSAVAWTLHLNVGNVGHRPGMVLRRHEAAVFIRPASKLSADWRVTAVNLRHGQLARCHGIPIRLARASYEHRIHRHTIV